MCYVCLEEEDIHNYILHLQLFSDYVYNFIAGDIINYMH